MEQKQPCCSQCWNARIGCNSNEIGLQELERSSGSVCLFHDRRGTSCGGGPSHEELRRSQLIDFIDAALDLIDNDDHVQDNIAYHDGKMITTTTTTNAPSMLSYYYYQPCSSRAAALAWNDFFEQPGERSSSGSMDDLVRLADCCGDAYDGDLSPPMIVPWPPSRTRSTSTSTLHQGRNNTPIISQSIIEQDASSTSTEEELPSSVTRTCSRENLNHKR